MLFFLGKTIAEPQVSSSVTASSSSNKQGSPTADEMSQESRSSAGLQDCNPT